MNPGPWRAVRFLAGEIETNADANELRSCSDWDDDEQRLRGGVNHSQLSARGLGRPLGRLRCARPEAK